MRQQANRRESDTALAQKGRALATRAIVCAGLRRRSDRSHAILARTPYTATLQQRHDADPAHVPVLTGGKPSSHAMKLPDLMPLINPRNPRHLPCDQLSAP
jgi:hypothetical protein